MKEIKEWKKIYKILFIIGIVVAVVFSCYISIVFDIRVPTVYDK